MSASANPKHGNLEKQYRNAIIILSVGCVIFIVVLFAFAIRKEWAGIFFAGMFFGYFFGALVQLLALKNDFLGKGGGKPQ